MTGSTTTASAFNEHTASTLRRVELRLRRATLRLGPGVSDLDVKVAQRTMDEAERTLGDLVDDPWGPSIALEARAILGSHLLAADACEGADAGTAVTANVLRRGAASAQRVLARHGYRPGSFEAAD